MFDIVTIGHFAIDYIVSSKIGQSKPTLGGPPTYTSLAARKLGAKVSAVSKIGDDFPVSYVKYLENRNIDLSGLKKIAGLDVFYYEWGGLVHGLRALQLNMQINQAEYLQFTLGTQDEKFETLKGEFWQIISTFKLF